MKMKLTLFEEAVKNVLSDIILESSFALADNGANEILNSFGIGYDYQAGQNVIDWNAEPLKSDYSKIVGKVKDPENPVELLDMPLYLKPEKNSINENVKGLGKAVVYWLSSFPEIFTRFDRTADLDTIGKRSSRYRPTQVYGLMLYMLFLSDESTYTPAPRLYDYYRVDIPTLNADEFGGQIMAEIANDSEAVAAKIDELLEDENVNWKYFYKFNTKDILRKTDVEYNVKRVSTSYGDIALDQSLCLTQEQFDKLSSLLGSDMQGVINNCRFHKDGTPIRSTNHYFNTPEDFVKRRFGNDDRPIPVGSDSDFCMYDGYVNCIKISDLIENKRDTSQGQNPNYKPAKLNIDGLFKQQGTKKYLWTYVWNETNNCAVAKKIAVDLMNF